MKRQNFEVDISVFLRQKLCGFGSFRKPISLTVVFHVHSKIQLFHPVLMPPTHQTGIRRLDPHDAVVTGHEKQAFDSCWQMVLGTLCDVLPPDVTGPTLQNPCVVWSVHTKTMRLPVRNMWRAVETKTTRYSNGQKNCSSSTGPRKRQPVISLN